MLKMWKEASDATGSRCRLIATQPKKDVEG